MRKRVFALLALLMALSLVVSVHAQGIVVDPVVSPMPPIDDAPVPPPPPVPLVWPGGPVRVELYRVQVSIEDQVATTRVEQVFANDGRGPVEGVYLFPLPQEAAISQFNMVVDGQRVEGKIMDKAEARAIYESIVRQRRDPALLEYVGRDLFQARIFPIPPGGERTIELTYSQVLPLDNGLVHYQYPLRTDRFNQHPVDQLAISVRIESTSRLKAIYSPSHQVIVSREGDYRAQVGYEDVNIRPQSDFDLYFSVDEAEVGVSLLSYKPAGEDGFFLLLAAPNVEVDSQTVAARDILLVLDTSGSMRGPKIQQARSALLYVLERLNPQDRFNIVSFSTGVRQFERGPQPLSRLADAKGFVSRLEAGGGTDINRALLEALAQVEANRPTVIIFLTDGLPTEGQVDPQRIVDSVRQEATANVRVFAFGVGDDVNTILLDTISQENRGASAYVRPNQTIDEIVSGFYAKVSTPVLTNLSLDFGPSFAEELYPYPLPDLFAGSQLVLTGRYRQGSSTVVTLKGLVNQEERTFIFDDLRLRTEGGEPFIARLWATRKIGYLLNEIRLRGRSQELVDEIVSLSTRYGIATPYTSFFVPEPEFPVPMMDQPGGPGTREPMPQPDAVQELGKAVEAEARSALEALEWAPAAGAPAVEESQAREALRSADTVAPARGDDTSASGLRYAMDKVFAYQAGLWVDTAFETTLPRVELAFGSEAYFRTLSERPEWSAYFAVSPNVIVVLDGKAFVVTDTGEPMADAPTPPAALPTAVTQPLATVVPDQPASPVATARPTETEAEIAVQPPSPSTPASPAAPLCTAPAFGVGLLLVPGVWAWRRQR